VERFPMMRLTASPEQLRWRPSLVMRGLEALPIRW
jgi:hypothetical protein